MTKYGRSLRFGYSLIPTAADPTRPQRLAALADTLDLDYVGIQDHSHTANHHETWTLVTAIAISTPRISVFGSIGNLSILAPDILAKAAASLDLLTRGRVEVGLAIGRSSDSHLAVGGKTFSNTEALAAMEEAIQIIRLIWSGKQSFPCEGKFYHTAELQPGPVPAHPIGIWLSANEPHALAMAGRLADGWIPDSYPAMQPSDLAALSKQLDDAATSAGRDPSEIQRIWNIAGTIGHEDSNKLFQGSAKQWAESLAQLAVEVGIDTFLLMEGENAEEQLEKFAREVVPHTRELVELAPGVSKASGLARAYQGASASGATPAEEKTGDVDWVDETSMESFPASDPPASSSFT